MSRWRPAEVDVLRLGYFRRGSAVLGTRSVMESLAAPSVEAMTPSTPLLPPNHPHSAALLPPPVLASPFPLRELFPLPSTHPCLTIEASSAPALPTYSPSLSLSLFLSRSLALIESAYVIGLLAHGHAIAFVPRRKQTGTHGMPLRHSGSSLSLEGKSR